MNHLTDQQLLQAIEQLVHREREILSDVLKHLKEIDRRKLFSSLGFTSLFDYATKQLKYSPDQAGRRIAAMRLLREVPEAEAKVIDGSLTLSALAQAHWHFKKVEHSKEEKREILVKLENASKKETKIILKQEDKVRYSFEADEVTETEIEKLRALNPHLNFDQLIKKIVRLALEKTDPEQKIKRAVVRDQKRRTAISSDVESGLKSRGEADGSPISNAQVFTSAGKIERGLHQKGESKKVEKSVQSEMRSQRASRYIPAQIKRDVWRKAEGKCTNCNSNFSLEFDHIVPFAKGGRSLSDNLRLLCRSCNQREGIRSFGATKMNRFRDQRLT